MKRWLITAAIAGPVLLGAAVVSRMAAAGPFWTTVVYSAAGLVCHQRPDRSFFTHGVQWPVCGRCAGLYLAAPVGAVAAFVLRKRSRLDAAAIWLAAAAVPTVASWSAEHLVGIPQSNLARAVLAVPLGAAVAYVLVRAVPD